MTIQKYDVVIIGGGPAGLTAAIYASRAQLKTLIIEKGAPGGKIVNTHKVDNWTGDISIKGADLAQRMYEHSIAYGAEYKYGNVKKLLSHKAKAKEIILESGETLKAKSIIIATGTVERVPKEIKGIEEYRNKGVSYCVICDGPFTKNKPAAIIGGGNSAVEEGTYLASIASKVYVLVRDKDFIAEKNLFKDLKKQKNVEILFNTSATEILGKGKVEKLKIITNGKESVIKVNAIFPYIGLIPVTEFVKHLNITNDFGYIITNNQTETKIENIFAIGDVREKEIRQIATAVADGAIAGKIVANKLRK